MPGYAKKFIPALTTRLQTFLSDEAGQDLIEYALVACLLGLGAIASIKNVGDKLATVFTGISTSVSNTI